MASDRPFDVPADRHYDGKHHLWAVQEDASGRVRIGIDAIGLASLGELAYVSLKNIGTTVARGDSIGTLEAAKMTTNIVSPVSGVIAARNETVLANPLLVNSSPYADGWLVELEATNFQAEALALVSGAAIPQWVTTETERLEAESGD